MKVASTYQLASVTSSVRDRSMQLAYGKFAYGGEVVGWSGTLSLAGMARGPIALVVTAADMFGHLTDLVVPLTLDRRPVITVSSPLDGAVARRTVNLVASCIDDDPAGCRTIPAGMEHDAYNILATGVDTLSTSLDLSRFEGQNRILSINSSIRRVVSLRVAGPWAIYGVGSELWRRDLVAGRATLVSAEATNDTHAVASNGDLAYVSSGDIYVVRDGRTGALTKRLE